MRFKCPRCGYGQLKLTDKICPHCALVLSVRPLLKYYWECWKQRLSEAAVARCPNCGKNVSLNATACECGASMKVGDAVDAALEPSRKRWHGFVNAAGPGMALLLRWLYLAISLFAGWWLLNYVQAQHSKQWIGYAALSTVYLGVLIFVGSWLLPQRMFQAVSRRARPVVKLALLANFLTLLLLLQLVIKTWWAQALALAGLIAVAVLGLILAGMLLSMKDKIQAENTVHTKTRPQGRKAVLD